MSIMTDFDAIWRTQDEIRTVVNAVLGECIWKLSYNEQRIAIELELTEYLEEEDADALICQFPVPADYDGAGLKGTKSQLLSLILRSITVSTIASNTTCLMFFGSADLPGW